jgi:hypothetical protein
MLYILSCYGNSLLDKIITKIAGDPITHTAIQISNNIIVETGVFGVKMDSISRLRGNYEKYEFIELSLENETILTEFILDSIKTRYDYKLMLAIGLNKMFGWKLKWDNPNKYICVEVIIEACKNVLGIDLIPNIDDESIGPWHIGKSPYLKKVE